MDPKKQDLSPELKEVYERVMNTRAPTPAAPTTPNATPQPAAAQPSVVPPTSQPTPAVPAAPTPVVAPPTPEAPKPADGASAQVVTPAAPGPTSFSFSGNKMTTPQGTTTNNAAKKKIPPFAIPIGVVVLIIAWAALWAKVFGLF